MVDDILPKMKQLAFMYSAPCLHASKTVTVTCDITYLNFIYIIVILILFIHLKFALFIKFFISNYSFSFTLFDCVLSYFI